MPTITAPTDSAQIGTYSDHSGLTPTIQWAATGTTVTVRLYRDSELTDAVALEDNTHCAGTNYTVSPALEAFTEYWVQIENEATGELSEAIPFMTVTSLDNPFTSASVNVSRFNAALADVTVNKIGGELRLGPGDWVINDTLTVRDVRGLVIRGTGKCTRLIWQGAANKPALMLAHTHFCRVEDIEIVFSPSYPGYAGVQILRDNIGSPTYVPTQPLLKSVSVQGNGYCTHGFVVGGQGSVDANNDFNEFRDCTASACNNGWYLTGSQSYGNIMWNCYGSSCSEYGVRNGDGAVACGFAWYRGRMGGNGIADFGILGTRWGERLIIDGVNCEASEMFIHIPVAGSRIMLDVVNCRWSVASSVNDVVMLINGPCRMTIEGNSMGSGDSGNHSPKFDIGAYANTRIEFRNNQVFSASIEDNVWVDQSPTVVEGNLIVEEIGLNVSELTG